MSDYKMMIAALPGWSFEVRGLEIRLAPLDAPAAGLLHYVEHLAPIATPHELAARIAGATVASTQTFRTVEGERASLTLLDAEIRGRPARRFLGQVFLDDHYAEIAGACVDPAHHARFAEAARALLTHDRHFLGDRRRGFEHTAPPGWTGRPLGSRLHRIWSRPDGAMALVVGAALPHRGSAIREVLDAALESHDAAHPHPLELLAPRGLHAEAWELRDRGATARHRLLAVVHDDRYVYPLHVDHQGGEHADALAVLANVVRSIEPLAPRHAGATAAFAQWTD